MSGIVMPDGRPATGLPGVQFHHAKELDLVGATGFAVNTPSGPILVIAGGMSKQLAGAMQIAAAVAAAHPDGDEHSIADRSHKLAKAVIEIENKGLGQ